MKRTAVGSRELKTRLGTYLRQVQMGHILVVTDRGRPVAELRPIEAARTSEESRIDGLVALGLLTRKSKDSLAGFKPLRMAGRPLSATILENREDRF